MGILPRKFVVYELFQFVGLLQVYTSVYKVNTCSNPAVKHYITVSLLGSNLAAVIYGCRKKNFGTG